MTIETNYSPARAELAQRLSRITDEREIAMLKRRKHLAVAMISAEELAGLMETAQLLRAPANAQRLLAALGRARLDTPPGHRRGLAAQGARPPWVRRGRAPPCSIPLSSKT